MESSISVIDPVTVRWNRKLVTVASTREDVEIWSITYHVGGFGAQRPRPRESAAGTWGLILICMVLTICQGKDANLRGGVSESLQILRYLKCCEGLKSTPSTRVHESSHFHSLIDSIVRRFSPRPIGCPRKAGRHTCCTISCSGILLCDVRCDDDDNYGQLSYVM